MIHLPNRGVSVPLRGKGRDQLGTLDRLTTPYWQFPSPCGEKVGINGRYMIVELFHKTFLFPSPCGEKVGINLCLRSVALPRLLRFRPLAGKR